MSKKYIIIFGASSDGRRIFRYLKKRKKNKIIFLDNDVKKNNLNFLQTKIYHPKKFKLHKNISEIYLGGRYMDEQFAQLKKINEFKNIKIIIMGYKLKTHSGAAKRFKKTGSSVKSRSANRNHILTKQSTKRKRHNRGLNKLTGTVLKMATALIRR